MRPKYYVRPRDAGEGSWVLGVMYAEDEVRVGGPKRFMDQARQVLACFRKAPQVHARPTSGGRFRWWVLHRVTPRAWQEGLDRLGCGFALTATRHFRRLVR